MLELERSVSTLVAINSQLSNIDSSQLNKSQSFLVILKLKPISFSHHIVKQDSVVKYPSKGKGQSRIFQKVTINKGI